MCGIKSDWNLWSYEDLSSTGMNFMHLWRNLLKQTISALCKQDHSSIHCATHSRKGIVYIVHSREEVLEISGWKALGRIGTLNILITWHWISDEAVRGGFCTNKQVQNISKEELNSQHEFIYIVFRVLTSRLESQSGFQYLQETMLSETQRPGRSQTVGLRHEVLSITGESCLLQLYVGNWECSSPITPNARW